MNRVQVFLGSSSELKNERLDLGNWFRELSYKWEERGVRIVLKRWEEFGNEYNGKSKQEEYNDELVKTSDIVITMFKSKLGPYTERELDASCMCNKANTHCFVFPFSKQQTFVDKLKQKGLAPRQVNNLSQLKEITERIIDEYVKKHQLQSSRPLNSHQTEMWIYASVGSDWGKKNMHQQIGNTVRSADDFVEATMNQRLKLQPFGDASKIEHSDYFMSVLNNTVQPNILNEIKQGVKLVKEHRKPVVNIYIKKGSRVVSRCPYLGRILIEHEIFPRDIDDSLATINLDLIIWAIRHTVGASISHDNLYSIENGYYCLNGFRLAKLELLAPRHLFNQHNELIRLLSNTTDIKHQHQIREAIRHNEQYLLMGLRERINIGRLIFDDSIMDDSSSIVQKVEEEDRLMQQQENLMIAQWSRSVDSISEQIRKYISSPQLKIDINEFKELTINRVKIEEKIYKRRPDKAEELLRILVETVALHDTYLIEPGWEDERDPYYQRIIDVADENHINLPYVEDMRINRANGYARKMQHGQALTLYRKAISNLQTMKCDNLVMMRLVAHAYTTMIHQLIESYPSSPEIDHALHQFEKNLSQWKASGLNCSTAEAQYIATRIHHLPLTDSHQDVIDEARKIYEELQAKPANAESMEYLDTHCYLPNVIACYYIDRINFKIDNHDTKGVIEYRNKAIQYSEIQINNAQLLRYIDIDSCTTYLSMAYHNMGFLYCKLGNYGLANENYKKALSCRENLYDIFPSSHYKLSIAETLVNYADFLLQIKTRIKNPEFEGDPLAVAKRALDIYREINQESSDADMLHFYQAMQMVGTCHYYLSSHDPERYSKQKGIELLNECWLWNISHPGNSYERTFIDHAGKILQKEGLR